MGPGGGRTAVRPRLAGRPPVAGVGRSNCATLDVTGRRRCRPIRRAWMSHGRPSASWTEMWPPSTPRPSPPTSPGSSVARSGDARCSTSSPMCWSSTHPRSTSRNCRRLTAAMLRRLTPALSRPAHGRAPAADHPGSAGWNPLVAPTPRPCATGSARSRRSTAAGCGGRRGDEQPT